MSKIPNSILEKIIKRNESLPRSNIHKSLEKRQANALKRRNHLQGLRSMKSRLHNQRVNHVKEKTHIVAEIRKQEISNTLDEKFEAAELR